jgi:hypothetical protein
MKATLYIPQQPPQAVPVDGLSMQDSATRFAGVLKEVPALMGCTLELVDILASGPDYVAYSIFDYEGPVNHAAMKAVSEVSGVTFDAEDGDTLLCGPVLVISAV